MGNSRSRDAELGLAVPNGRYVEAFHPDVDPVWYDFLSDRPEISGGTIDLPDALGLGVELDDALSEEYAVTR